jgi:gamma-glutamyl-gamma-aminobutyrate hydrolase PuuD
MNKYKKDLKILITPRLVNSLNDQYYSLSIDWFNLLKKEYINFDILTGNHNFNSIENYDGIILSGGGDLSSNNLITNHSEIDIEREYFEKKLIFASIEKKYLCLEFVEATNQL